LNVQKNARLTVHSRADLVSLMTVSLAIGNATVPSLDTGLPNLTVSPLSSPALLRRGFSFGRPAPVTGPAEKVTKPLLQIGVPGAHGRQSLGEARAKLQDHQLEEYHLSGFKKRTHRQD
jgi:hypothetical protein